MKKLVFVAPHLSTGGLPQYLYKKISLLKDKYEIFCLEYENITGGVLVIQRNRIESILDSDHFITIGDDKTDLYREIKRINPDYVHLEEIPEYFLDNNIADLIYSKDRTYKIFETSHDSSFDPVNRKIYLPDAFLFVSQWQIDQYQDIDVPKYLAEYPIEYKERPDRDTVLRELGLDPAKKHVLNVGLFTPRKNQAEIFEIARSFGDDVQFHFLGNTAGNFHFYWEPLLRNKPNNCVLWGERSDTDTFYSCMDLFLFTSQGNPGNKETMPLVLRESLGWKIPILLYNLDVYQDYFHKFDTVTYLESDQKENIEKIKVILGLSDYQEKYISTTYDPSENKLTFQVLKEHPEFKKFSYVIRDAVTGLTFQPIGNDIDLVKGLNWWMIPNAVVNDHNGVLFEAFLPNGEKICSDRYENWGEGTKTTYSPLKYPKTQLVINDRPIQFHHDIKDQSAYWSYYECVLRQDYKGIESGDVCVDVGANLGFFSLSAIKQGAAKCYSLEPFPTTFEYLTKNTEGLPIQPINVGIGSEDKEVFFVGGEVTSISRNVEHEDKEAYSFWGDNINRVPVRLKPFDQVIKENDIKFIDYLKIDCEGGEVELFNTIDPDFLKHRVKKIAGEIHLFVTGVDGYLKIKNQIIDAGFEYEDDYKEGEELVVFFARRKPKIKLIHILNDIDGVREKASINSLKALEEYGIHYEQHVSPLYKDLPPAENCNRPSQVSLEPGDYLLSPGHYGCYLGHKGAVCNSGEDFDAVVISECDTILQASAKEMSEKFEQVYFENIKNDLILTSFGKRLEGFEHEHVTDDIYWSRKIVEAHLYLISKPHLGELRRLFNEKPWDVADLWYDVFVSTYKRGITKKPYALQAVGNSYLDKTFKDGHLIHDFNVVYDPNRIDDDITVIVQTCDKYENIWSGWHASFSKFWTWETGWPVYFCNEEKDLPFNDSRINQIKSPKSENADGFSTRLIDILSKVKTKYVLYLQEDMWLMNKLDVRTLKESLYKMRYNDWNCLRIHEKIWLSYELMKTNQFVNGRRILKSKSTSEWLLSHNASIWNREFLLSQMEPGENPWKNEINGTVRICNKFTDPKIYHLNERWYYQPGASQNGRLNDFMAQYQEYLVMGEDLEKQFDTKDVK